MGYFNFTNGSVALNDTNLKALQKEILKTVFPIGSTYITQDNTNPSTILEFGTWVRVKGKVSVGLDEDDTNFNAIGKTGGETSHALTVEELARHDHNISIVGIGQGQYGYNVSSLSIGSEQKEKTGLTGEGKAHNNLQPYIVTGYMWRRTA